MAFTGFSRGTSIFLADLAENNDRAWFAENRQRYDRDLLGPQREFVDAIGSAFAAVDQRVHADPAVNRSIFRTNRDTRFSRDKSPYKTYADLWFWIGDDRKTAAAGHEIGEATLKRVPAGFSAQQPRTDLLHYTSVHAILQESPPPAEFESAAFVDWCMDRFAQTKPLVDWLAEHLGGIDPPDMRL